MAITITRWKGHPHSGLITINTTGTFDLDDAGANDTPDRIYITSDKDCTLSWVWDDASGTGAAVAPTTGNSVQNQGLRVMRADESQVIEKSIEGRYLHLNSNGTATVTLSLEYGQAYWK